MRKGERILIRVALSVIGVLSVSAVVLQILNEKTDVIETTYQIITFSVSITALTIAIMQGQRNGQQAREINRIAKETRLAIKEFEEIDKENNQLKRKITDDINISKQTLELVRQENAHLAQIIESANKAQN